MSKPVEAGSLKVGSFIVIDNEPCKIVEIERSKPGKHGSAKVRITAIGFFDRAKRSIVAPAGATVETPIIVKRSAQVIAILRDTVQLMDLDTYEVYEVSLPSEEEIKSKLNVGVEVEIWELLGRRKIIRVKR